MKNPVHMFRNHITIAKLISLALLFSPLWGFWWFDAPQQDVGNYSVLTTWSYSLFQNIPVAIVYTSVCLLAFAGFVITTFIRLSVVRLPLMLLMLIGWAAELLFLDINGTGSNQNLFWILWQELALGMEVFGGYAPDIIRDCTFVVILGIALCASPARRFSVPGIFGLLPIMSGTLVAGVTIYTKGATQAFPIPFGTLSNAAIVLASTSSGDTGFMKLDGGGVVVNRDVEIEGTVDPIFNKVVMIMDESVRGDYLSLNNATQKTTPFLKATGNLVNFGVAISGANCSAISRPIFRFGMRQSDLPNRWREGLTKPTFWQFAHKAGYKTVHIDMWNGPMSFRNGLSLAEKTLIDSNIHDVSQDPAYLRDKKVVYSLLQVLKDEEPAFIYVEKLGVHFPYSNKYPPDFHPFSVPARSDIAYRHPFVPSVIHSLLYPQSPLFGKSTPSTDSDRETVVDRESVVDYEHAIAWSVDEFFRGLLPAVDLSKTLIIYTSDHGQNLLPHHATHCSTTNAAPSEAYVPLFAITSVPEFKQRLEKGAAHGFGGFSHFEVFPTLLLAMGYDPGWVKRSYGPSLMDSPSPERKFMIGSPDLQPMMIPADRNFIPTSSPSEAN